jgi:hypothetical protein
MGEGHGGPLYCFYNLLALKLLQDFAHVIHQWGWTGVIYPYTVYRVEVSKTHVYVFV